MKIVYPNCVVHRHMCVSKTALPYTVFDTTLNLNVNLQYLFHQCLSLYNYILYIYICWGKAKPYNGVHKIFPSSVFYSWVPFSFLEFRFLFSSSVFFDYDGNTFLHFLRRLPFSLTSIAIHQFKVICFLLFSLVFG